MGDFHQSGIISTLHYLKKRNIDEIEAELTDFSKVRPLALILPSLYLELKGDAFPNIVKQLKAVPYLNEIIVSLDKASKEEFDHAKRFFSVLPQDVQIIWNDGDRIRKLFKTLEEKDLPVNQPGKGKAVWIALGYVIARQSSKIITLHDCDIITYDRDLLARLSYPIADYNLGYEYAKGYYRRVSDRLYGRVTRLFVTPLINSLISILGHVPYLEYLDSFRYPLAGEFSMTVDLARVVRIPSDWGLEIGVLAEIYRNCALKRICQVDITQNYDHKHRPLSAKNPERGLLKMSIDIATSLFTTLASEGVVLSDSLFNALLTKYLRIAQDTIKQYYDVAAINGLLFDRHAEGTAVEAFIRGLKIASERYMTDPLAQPLIQNWNRVTAAIPNFLEMLHEAVALDNR
jgi:glucosyl-3-phosphoglycerate synthase